MQELGSRMCYLVLLHPIVLYPHGHNFLLLSQVQTKSEVGDIQQGNSSLILSDRTVETKEEDIQSFTNKLEPVTEGNLEILDWCGDNLTKFQQNVIKEFGRHVACYSERPLLIFG